MANQKLKKLEWPYQSSVVSQYYDILGAHTKYDLMSVMRGLPQAKILYEILSFLEITLEKSNLNSNMIEEKPLTL